LRFSLATFCSLLLPPDNDDDGCFLPAADDTEEDEGGGAGAADDVLPLPATVFAPSLAVAVVVGAAFLWA
jgi:hypothetical protein